MTRSVVRILALTCLSYAILVLQLTLLSER